MPARFEDGGLIFNILGQPNMPNTASITLGDGGILFGRFMPMSSDGITPSNGTRQIFQADKRLEPSGKIYRDIDRAIITLTAAHDGVYEITEEMSSMANPYTPNPNEPPLKLLCIKAEDSVWIKVN